MRLRSVALALFVFVVVSFPSSVSAQEASRWDLGVAAVAVQYDLSGVGNAPGVAVRSSRELWPNVALEIRGLIAKPDQQFGPSTFFVPEAQLQYRWNVARFSPYV